jgi:hypothetical protein
LERDSLGGALDLDLLSPFLQKDATNSGGQEVDQALKGQQGRRENIWE